MLTNQFDSSYQLLISSSQNLASLFLRLYLAPIFWMAGMSKFNSFEDTVSWFGDTEWGLGLPFPWLMAALATAAELAGAILLTLGLMTRFISIPLIITMLVAITCVHWGNGWQAIADVNAPFANAQVMSAPEKLAQARHILQEHGDYEWLTSSGKFVILNNGIEFAATYLIMLLALIGLGAGKYHSLDYWLARIWQNKKTTINLPAMKQEC
ncbi:MAG: AraC family transcriptional regulator [Cellvibrio sp. 79]|nr:MAG: AraC family transcriptional regulator [Cellvibrio sp. 79]